MFIIIGQRIYIRFSLFHIFLHDIFLFTENSEITRYTDNVKSGGIGGDTSKVAVLGKITSKVAVRRKNISK